MNITPAHLAIAATILIQSSAAIWWASGINSEVERVANVQSSSIPPLQVEAKNCSVAIHDQGQQIERIKELTAETSGLDVLSFKVDELRKEIVNLRRVDEEIMTQHEKIFEWMANQNSPQQKGSFSYD